MGGPQTKSEQARHQRIADENAEIQRKSLGLRQASDFMLKRDLEAKGTIVIVLRGDGVFQVFKGQNACDAMIYDYRLVTLQQTPLGKVDEDAEGKVVKITHLTPIPVESLGSKGMGRPFMTSHEKENR